MPFLPNSREQGVSGKYEQLTQTPWCGAQCSCIGCIGLRPALIATSKSSQHHPLKKFASWAV